MLSSAQRTLPSVKSPTSVLGNERRAGDLNLQPIDAEIVGDVLRVGDGARVRLDQTAEDTLRERSSNPIGSSGVIWPDHSHGPKQADLPFARTNLEGMFSMADQSSRPVDRPKARLPRGFQDSIGGALGVHQQLITKLAEVYASYGFERLATPCVEFADALGKFLPDQNRPNEGVFSFQDDDAQWLVLRYDLTAPLARYVAENYDTLAFPFRRFQTGSVFRDEKPGPGRFREFIQFDADTVGTSSMAADAEFCMLVADALEALGLLRGEYVVRVNNRKVLNGILELIGVPLGPEGEGRRLGVLRAMDKLDRLGVDGVGQLLGAGRKDESGDFTKGAGLTASDIDRVLGFLNAAGSDRSRVCTTLADLVNGSAVGEEGVAELMQIDATLTAAGFDFNRVRIDPAVVRGLAYYTGPVFEAELTFEITGEDSRPARFGSVGGGGRYDDLVERFLGKKVPATGVSIGVSRLAAALQMRGLLASKTALGPVVVLVLDHDQLARYQAMVSDLRAAGVRAELYLGDGGMRAQLRYADKRGAPIVVIEGEDERTKGLVTVKDMALGAQLSGEIKSREEWAKGGASQVSVKREDITRYVREALIRH
jgi:histidyl-tRNA synthetase